MSTNDEKNNGANTGNVSSTTSSQIANIQTATPLTAFKTYSAKGSSSTIKNTDNKKEE